MSIEITPDNIGDILRELAHDKDMTQYAIADITGIEVHTINRLFTNKGYSPNIKTVYAIAKALNKKVVLK